MAHRREDRARQANRKGCLVPLILLPLLLLGGCVGLVAAISAAGGVVSIAKDVLDIDTSLSQDKPGKTPIGKVLAP